MMPNGADDTIFALSSGTGRAGVAVIRVTGRQAQAVLQEMCTKVPAARMAAVMSIRSPADGGQIDEGIVLWMPGPASFTGEDVVEFHVHGGPATVSRLMLALAETGHCRLADAGEFTRRAFYNGKMDLVAVEGLADLIAADTEAQRYQALFHKFGGASAKFNVMRTNLISILARIEAAIDFVDEEGVEQAALEGVLPDLSALQTTLTEYLNDNHRGERLRDGVKVVIAGPPNVGKSSLLNALARRDAAIVSPIEGTTRDAIEVNIDLAGVPVTFVDTAGLRETSSDQIELLGMAKTTGHMSAADLIIWVEAPDVDTGQPPQTDSDTLRVLNKVDLPGGRQTACGYEVAISALDDGDVRKLVEILAVKVEAHYLSDEPALITRQRHRAALQDCLGHVSDALAAKGQPLELLAENVRLATRALSKLVGQVNAEDLLDVIFSEFCIGK